MARVRFLVKESAAQAFTWFTYDAEEAMAYVDDKEQAVLHAARGTPQLRADLCAELREVASASAAVGRSVRVVARVAHADVLHADMPPGGRPSPRCLTRSTTRTRTISMT
jgi:hypothetical protein